MTGVALAVPKPEARIPAKLWLAIAGAAGSCTVVLIAAWGAFAVPSILHAVSETVQREIDRDGMRKQAVVDSVLREMSKLATKDQVVGVTVQLSMVVDRLRDLEARMRGLEKR